MSVYLYVDGYMCLPESVSVCGSGSVSWFLYVFLKSVCLFGCLFGCLSMDV